MLRPVDAERIEEFLSQSSFKRKAVSRMPSYHSNKTEILPAPAEGSEAPKPSRRNPAIQNASNAHLT